MLFGGTKKGSQRLVLYVTVMLVLAGSAGWHCHVTRGMPETLSSEVPRVLLQ